MSSVDELRKLAGNDIRVRKMRIPGCGGLTMTYVSLHDISEEIRWYWLRKGNGRTFSIVLRSESINWIDSLHNLLSYHPNTRPYFRVSVGNSTHGYIGNSGTFHDVILQWKMDRMRQQLKGHERHVWIPTTLAVALVRAAKEDRLILKYVKPPYHGAVALNILQVA